MNFLVKILLGAAAIFVPAIWKSLTQKSQRKIFVSYRYIGDAKYKNMLVAWSKNESFDFEFDDTSTDVSIDSTDIGAIRRVISRRINEADCLVCIVGEHTHKSSWVKWEVRKAVELSKRIIAIKTNSRNTSPDELKNVGAIWVNTFTKEPILEAINSI